jgi:hypothetical protein
MEIVMMNDYISRYTNGSFRLVFSDDEYSPRLILSDDSNKPCTFQIAFSTVDNPDLDKLRLALQFAASAFNAAFEFQLGNATKKNIKLTQEQMLDLEMAYEEIDF